MAFPTNGLPLVSSYPPVDKPVGWERMAADTYLPNGQQPQTVGLTTFDVAGLFAAMSNTGTESSNAITLNAIGGLITTASQSLAVGSTYVITLTNSAILATSTVRAVAYGKSNVVPGVYVVSVVVSAGSCVITLGNANVAGTSLSGTCFVAFLVSSQ